MEFMYVLKTTVDNKVSTMYYQSGVDLNIINIIDFSKNQLFVLEGFYNSHL